MDNRIKRHRPLITRTPTAINEAYERVKIAPATPAPSIGPSAADVTQNDRIAGAMNLIEGAEGIEIISIVYNTPNDQSVIGSVKQRIIDCASSGCVGCMEDLALAHGILTKAIAEVVLATTKLKEAPVQ